MFSRFSANLLSKSGRTLQQSICRPLNLTIRQQCLHRQPFTTTTSLFTRKHLPKAAAQHSHLKHHASHQPSNPTHGTSGSEGEQPEGTNLKPIALFILTAICMTSLSMLLGGTEDTPDPNLFHPYTLLSHTVPSPQTHLLTLSVPPALRPALNLTDPTQPAMLSLEVKEPNIQVSRHYTPLQGPRGGTIELYVKAYPGGSLSPYLAQLREGDIVEMRGPRAEMEGLERDRQAEETGAVQTNVLLLTGGTGIAVGCQFLERYFGTSGGANSFPAGDEVVKEVGGEIGERSNPLVILHHNVRNPQEIQFLTDRLRRVATYSPLLESGSLQVQTHTDTTPLTPSPSLSPHRIINLLEEWQNDSLQRGERTRNVVLVSGPPGFVRYWAGAKGWERGEETQGELGGILGGMIEKWRAEGGEWGVWKF
ncbi:hypothetical protein BJ508DRAFT_413192 [Ascobolus immersus RN42]|uniref:FAD-binding FR-type domain-containing protein n=1 Tax=Ascobolus immersus RN42 TaxID=1160509 RepID=A0A3N4II64_ASCIM|nr:hypothetical protein BJ508DRAFT_413192 [Ascobolus immersus RN42]